MHRQHSSRRTSEWTLVLAACSILLASVVSDGRAQLANIPYEIAPLNAPFPMPELTRPVFPDRTFDIRDYGAVPAGEDGEPATAAIQRTIEAASAAGGGTVLIPAGEWLTGPIHLRSNINLHVAEGAIVRFSTNRDDYLPVVRVRYEGVEAYNYSPLIYANGATNVALTGGGVLDGQGRHWWEWARQYGAQPRMIATKEPLSRRAFGKGAGMEGMRPNFAVFFDCENVLIEGITLNDTPMWNVHLVYTRNAIVRGITVNSLEAPNGDGVVIDSSRNVLVEYNTLRTGDDAVVLKSGLNEEGLQINIPTENVIVRNYEALDVRTGSGGVVFGSETSGGIRNVYVHNALFAGSDRGIRFKTERGRGNVIENIFIHDIVMRDINIEAITVNTFYTGPQAQGPSPAIRNVQIRNVEVDGARTGISLVGLPEKWLENFVMEDVTIRNTVQGARITRVKNLVLTNVDIQSTERALVFDDVLEISLSNVRLSDEQDGPPMALQGRYTGAVYLNDYPTDQAVFEAGATPAVVLTEPFVQAW